MRIQKLTIVAMLVAMCLVGANIKLMGSIAFDAAPAFVGTLLLGPIYGVALGFWGHLVSSLIAGFPLSLPVHIIVAIMMAITMCAYSMTRKWINKMVNHTTAIILSSIIAFLLNCPLSLLALYPLLGDMVYALFVPLASASVCNIFVAEVLFAAFSAKLKQRYTVS